MMYFLLVLLMAMVACNEQRPDLGFDTSVKDPAYRNRHPSVLFDEAHRNFHTAGGRYKPFVNLVTNDGYRVVTNDDPFTVDLLKPHNVLVISNAMGRPEKHMSAFTPEECRAVESWVREGGALLLIADHHPMGGAAQILASEFGVHMSNGFTSDALHYEGSERYKDQLVFTRDNGFLGQHAVMVGRSGAERIHRLVTFTGQSLKGPDHATVLLILSDAATETVADSIWKDSGSTYTRFQDSIPAPGRNQGLAMQHGKGRVIVLGEAAMLTAQTDNGQKFGMNLPGNDNKQFALNVMHWLTGILP